MILEAGGRIASIFPVEQPRDPGICHRLLLGDFTIPSYSCHISRIRPMRSESATITILNGGKHDGDAGHSADIERFKRGEIGRTPGSPSSNVSTSLFLEGELQQMVGMLSIVFSVNTICVETSRR